MSILQTKGDDIFAAQTGRQDFSTAQAPAEDIIVKCSLEQIIKSFFQNYAIVWHDPNVYSQENKQYIAKLKRFCEVFPFTEWQTTRDCLRFCPVACHVITSGTNGERLVKEIHGIQKVVNIYIFCGNKEYHSNWAKNYPKVSCIETNIESILSRIQHNLLEWYKQASSLKLNLPAFAPIFNDTDKSTMNNLHRFLKVIPHFQNRLQAKKDFLDLSRAIYSDPQNVKFMADFEQHYNAYDKEQTLRWYSQESFLYKVTNNCLRIATSDSIQYCRLLLQDIQKAIREQYQAKSKNFGGLLYRGAYLSDQEWSSLKANLNREIEMHGFLSVSKDKNVGLNFMKTDPSKKALITIIVPKGPNEEEQGFADMEEFSQFPQEKEILFNVRSRFTILETEDEPYRHLVLLYGAQGFRRFITEQNPILEVPIPTPENVVCLKCKARNSQQMFFISLRDPQKQIYYCQKCLDHSLAPFLCIPPTKEAYKANIQGCLLRNSHASELPFYGYKCSNCQAKKQKLYFTYIDWNQRWCQSCFEKYHNCTHNIILEASPFSFWYQKMSPAELIHFKFQNDLVSKNDHLFRQAEMYFESQLYEKAIEYYSIYIRQNEANGKDENIAYCLHSIGLNFQQQGEYNKALEYYFKSVEVSELSLGDNHPHTATTYSSIGEIYDKQGKYTKALEYFFKALDCCKTVYGYHHRNLSLFYRNIASVYTHQGEYKKALEYDFKSLDTAKSLYGDNHPNVSDSYQNIGVNFNSQGQYKKALEYYFKALEIQKSLYGDNHPTSATIYNNIGLAYENQGEYKKALEYYFKALAIRKSLYGDNHSELVFSYQNIGSIYERQEKYKEALEYHFKALEIQKSVYGDIHPGIAVCYNHIGLTFFNQGEDKKALEYYFKALDIYKAVYGNSHPEMTAFYSNIGSVYAQQGEYEKALEYYLKSLEVGKLAYGEGHPLIAISYNNLGFVAYNQGKYKQALEYYFKSLQINKSVYGGDNHPEIADNYNNIGDVYRDQGENTLALEYYLKARDVTKLFYGEDHSKTIEAQKRIFQIQSVPPLD